MPKTKNQTMENKDMVQFDNEENVDVMENQEPPKTAPYVPSKPTVRFKVPEKEQRIFRLANEKRQGTVLITCTEDVFDPETKKVRRARLIRGAQSIWFDQQEQFDDKYVGKNQINLEFHKGICMIPVHEKLKLQFAELSNRNTDNPNKFGAKDIYFKEWNPTKIAEQEQEEENNIIKAMQIAATSTIDDILPHASYLGIQFVDEMGQHLDEVSLRTEYMKKAKNESAKFLSSIHSPVVSMSFKVRKAIEKGLIDLGKQPNQAYWVDGGFISALPKDRDAVEFLIEFSQLHNQESTAFASQLRELVK